MPCISRDGDAGDAGDAPLFLGQTEVDVEGVGSEGVTGTE